MTPPREDLFNSPRSGMSFNSEEWGNVYKTITALKLTGLLLHTADLQNQNHVQCLIWRES